MVIQLIAHQTFFCSIVHVITRIYHYEAVLPAHQAQAGAFQSGICIGVFFIELITAYVDPLFLLGRSTIGVSLVFSYFSDPLTSSIILVIGSLGCAAIGPSLADGFYTSVMSWRNK